MDALMNEQDELMGSYMNFKLDDDGEVVEDEAKGFTMKLSDTFTPCTGTKKKDCDPSDGTKCEL